MDNNSAEQVRILITEDDDGHARLIQSRLKTAGVINPMQRFVDGEELLAYLAREARGGKGGAAFLLLLDIRMPGLDGIEVLRRLKADEAFKSIPVIMLSTNDDKADIARCYDLGCSSYLVKPVEYPAFAEVIRRLGLYIGVMRVNR